MNPSSSSRVRRSPRREARLAGMFYLLVFVIGSASLKLTGGAGLAANVIADVIYVIVTLLFFDLFRAVNQRVSALAALFGLTGCVTGLVNITGIASSPVNPLVFFGIYCLLVAYLIRQSTFLPNALAAGMFVAGLGWLTFLSPELARLLNPFNMSPGMLGEGALTLWLLIVGVDETRWSEQQPVHHHETSAAQAA